MSEKKVELGGEFKFDRNGHLAMGEWRIVEAERSRRLRNKLLQKLSAERHQGRHKRSGTLADLKEKEDGKSTQVQLPCLRMEGNEGMSYERGG